MSSLLKKISSEFKVSGISKIRLKYLQEDARIAWEKMGFKHVNEKGYMELHLDEDCLGEDCLDGYCLGEESDNISKEIKIDNGT